MKIILLMLITLPAFAQPKLSEFYLEAEKAYNTNRTYGNITGENVAGWVNGGFKLEEGLLYNETKIIGEYSNTQFRYIQLNLEFGAVIHTGVELYYRHESGHMLDYNKPGGFPEQNSFGVRINFIGD